MVITKLASPYALLLLYLPHFLLCVFYSKAGVHVKTLWSSSGQHAVAGVHLTSVHLRSQPMQIALPLTFKQGGVQVVGAISCSCAHSEKRISGQIVCLKRQESTAIDSKLKIVVTARAGWFK